MTVGWTEVEADADGGRRWERDDGLAFVTVRETAAGDWAVALDRLEQAPEGRDYEHETVAAEDEALDLAATWRDRFDRPA